MKKIIAFILILTIAGTELQAQSDTTKKVYYYYPLANVYYNPATMDYYFYDTKTSSWITDKELPKMIDIGSKDRYETVYYNGQEVWLANPEHRKSYPKSSPPKK
jgi:hypothetical protein